MIYIVVNNSDGSNMIMSAFDRKYACQHYIKENIFNWPHDNLHYVCRISYTGKVCIPIPEFMEVKP